MEETPKKTEKILVIFIILILCFLIFFSIVYTKIIIPRKIPTLVVSKTDVAVRGSIYSQDGFNLAASKKLYKVSVNTESIDPDKKQLFVNLFSIYSNIPKQTIREKISQKGYIVISYTISPNTAANLRQLNSKLLSYDVFREYEDKSGRIVQKMGLGIEVSGISRIYAYGSILEPVIGYTKKVETGRITITQGVKGVEKYRDGILSPKQDGKIEGKRDIGFNVIENKSFTSKSRQDGFDVALSIPLKLQKKIEEILDTAKNKYKSDEIVVGIINPKTGEILSLATTNRFDPKNIKKTDYSHLNVDAIEVSFEPGSTIKPIVYSILLDKKLINPLQSIDLNNGYYKLGKYIIRDDSIPAKNPIIEDVIIRSSNVGMIKLSQHLSGKEFYDGLKQFGLSELTGIDLPYEKNGLLPSVKLLSGEIYKASASYGYGLRTTFIQLLRAYSVFSNGGYLVTPHLTQNLTAPNGDIYIPKLPPKKRVIAPLTSQKMQDTLIKVVTSGTGKAAKVAGVIVGGKTGTARIAKEGKYDSLYNGSFFGFAKDDQNVYTIGVVAFGSHGSEDYYGSQTAAPIFKEIVELLKDQGYLRAKTAKNAKK
ncbi:penicillin-binding protein 2 [Helicobacter sp. 11S02596-1]|uniref:peptidoglycan D,D-transpeptidase FtsI family protein n=1 Tax=Helicobacter sp. 11S02596-1 TaxID=1476194 RepID=UPI000BA6A95E|nr:penicillin-binding protein 2 [Helicobacter sp. 11S02596-1]PAF43144.1 penicillin-binding protein [Helicobacter sp. 11S02596-1]